ncbi:MAG: DUF1826 domain-containing protein [Pseudomonadota bacterium]
MLLMPDPIDRSAALGPLKVLSNAARWDAIKSDLIEAMIWDRSVPQELCRTLSTVPAVHRIDGRETLTIDRIADYVTTLTRLWGLDPCAATEWLARDIAMLAARLTDQIGDREVLVRIEWIEDNACCKFHCDRVEARVICTYLGPGTEYGFANAQGEVGDVAQVPTGCPIVLKGKLWPGVPPSSLLHRSPAIEGTGQTRLVVVLNEAL